MAANPIVVPITPPRVAFLTPDGFISREWYRFLLSLATQAAVGTEDVNFLLFAPDTATTLETGLDDVRQTLNTLPPTAQDPLLLDTRQALDQLPPAATVDQFAVLQSAIDALAGAPAANAYSVVYGGALGTPSSGTITNLTGTASININGTVGATTPTTGAFTAITATSIKFGSGTVLSTYEEGTWAPAFAAWTTAPTFSAGRYIKIGSQVTVILLGQSGVNAGNQAITGLPFANSSAVTPTGALKVFGSSTLSSLCNIDNSATSINSFSPVTLTGNYWSLSLTYFVTF